MNKKAAFTDLLLVIIFTVIIVVVLGIFVYIGGRTNRELHIFFDNRDLADNMNGSTLVEDTMGAVNTSYQSLTWISFFLIVGLIIASIMGSYLVTTHPVFFIPYIFILIIAVIVAAGISNSYELLAQNDELESTYTKFTMSNIVMQYLPIWILITGLIGGIVMFTRLGSGGQQTQQYYV
jgi:hypothetical protein